jgi:hypothetical protein
VFSLLKMLTALRMPTMPIAMAKMAAIHPVLPNPTPLPDVLPSPPTQAFTTKEWILPPRPKPGRKPATDVPPTKRKAQNRAAQRAFRERRARRVGELEEKLKETEHERSAYENELHDQIKELEYEVETWKQKYHDEVNANMRRNADLPSSVSIVDGKISPASTTTDTLADDNAPALGCNKCTLTHCQCLSEILIFQSSGPEKRPLSPPLSLSPSSSSQRSVKRQCTAVEPDHSEMETDFTSYFASQRVPTTTNITPMSSIEADKEFKSCGLCAPGSSCICASIDKENELERSIFGPNDEFRSSFEPSGSSVLEATPTASAAPSKGPGSCLQCQRDPQARLFCTSLASLSSESREKMLRSITKDGANAEAITSSTATPPVGCCGGTTAAGAGCCRSANTAASSKPAEKKETMSCSDAYRTLRHHPNFSEALRTAQAREVWLPRLHSRSVPQTIPSSASSSPVTERELTTSSTTPVDSVKLRTRASKSKPDNQAKIPTRVGPLEIEAASVMGVFRLFERRFGEENR